MPFVKFADPDIVSDPKEYQMLAQSVAEPDEVVSIYRKFKDCEKQLEETKVLAKGGGNDEDMVEIISYEIDLMSKQLAELKDNLKLCIILEDTVFSLEKLFLLASSSSIPIHHQHGRWQARIGRVAGNKDLYLGTFKAAEAYDVAAIKFRGLSAVTNFDMSRYDVKSILESTTLPIGGAAKRLKDMEHVELNVEGHRTDQEDHSSSILNSHLPQGISNNYAGGTTHHHNWLNSLSFHQPQPCNTIHYPYGQTM
ncbi:hypothetical protein VNO80_00005 [Phaseolus coccineus]|uniref:AP2/ERF domain-containing protein n=1 Tax=Phaseolus coccineus TaxID=3886 RepID=A0AAN9NZ71_PHACN